jgi:hypothetical protein
MSRFARPATLSLLSALPQGTEPALLDAANMFAASGGQMVYPQDVIRSTHTPLYNVREYAAAGQTSLVFFDGQQKNEWVCNLDGGKLPNNELFLARAIRIKFTPGIVTATGARIASSGGSIALADAATSADAAAAVVTLDGQLAAAIQLNEIATAVRAARLRYTLDGALYCEVRGLDAFVEGGSVVADVALAVETNAGVASAAGTTVGGSIANVRMGSGMAGDAFTLPWHVIPPQRVVSVALQWQTALTLTSACPVQVSIDGTRFTLVNV